MNETNISATRILIGSTLLFLRKKDMNYSIELKDGLVLTGMIKSPGDKMHAIIIFVHGLGEHIQRYTFWADLLIAEGIGFTGVDLPGHGRSDGSRGNIRSFTLTDEMIDILQDSTCKTFPGVPVFIYGHSLGGSIVLDYLLRKKPDFKGAIVTSPWLKLAFEPDRFKLTLVSLLKFVLPNLTVSSGLVVNHLSHDKEVVDRYIADSLAHGKISVGLFHSALTIARHSLANAVELEIPLLLMHGSDDMICSPEGAREFASRTRMAELKIWEGGYHEIHNEPFNMDVLAYIVSWIRKMLS